MRVERTPLLTPAVATAALAIGCAAPRPPPPQQRPSTRTTNLWLLPEGPPCPAKPVKLDEPTDFGFSIRDGLKELGAGEQRFALGEDRGGFLESIGLEPGVPSTDRLTLGFAPSRAERYTGCPDGHDSNEILVWGTVTAKLSQGLTLSGFGVVYVESSQGRATKGSFDGWVSSGQKGCQLVWQLSPEGVTSSALLHGEKADARWNPIQPPSL